MFLSLEGMEGSGKSTLQRLLAEALTAKGHEVLCTREPGGCTLGIALRSLLLDSRQQGLDSRAELLLFLADRAQHVAEVIVPALDQGKVVLCDRYTDSTLAYQGAGRGLNMEFLDGMNAFATGGLMPHRTFLIDVPVPLGLQRAKGRNFQQDLSQSEGRFEAEALAFHESVRHTFLALAQRFDQRFVVLNGQLPPQSLVETCLQSL